MSNTAQTIALDMIYERFGAEVRDIDKYDVRDLIAEAIENAKRAEVFVIQDEMGDVIDVTDNREWAEWQTREDDDNPIRTLYVDTLWSGPQNREDWE